MITILSRYTHAETNNQGLKTAVRKELADVYVQKYSVKVEDTLEGLATQIYGDPSLWWRIADLNPQIRFPLDLKPGMVIRIPK
jgi:nucleoid-associated protein YgaU